MTENCDGVAVTPVGNPAIVKFTLASKPLSGEIPIETAVVEPCWTDALAGIVSEKSGLDGGGVVPPPPAPPPPQLAKPAANPRIAALAASFPITTSKRVTTAAVDIAIFP